MTVGHQKGKAKLVQLECEMQRSDDLLILFGWRFYLSEIVVRLCFVGYGKLLE